MEKAEQAWEQHEDQQRQANRPDNQGYEEYFVHDYAGRLIGRYAPDGSPIREYIYFNGEPVAVIANNEVHLIHTDHLGTPRAVTDADGETLWTWHADAFGREQPNEDASNDGQRFTFNLRFPGQYHDRETGLHYNWHRYYDPTTGRYTRPDPIGLNAGDPNL